MQGLAPAIARWVLYGAVSVLIGAALLRFLVLRRPSSTAEETASSRAALATWGSGAAVLLVAAVAAVLWFQLVAFRDPFEPLGAELHLLVMGTLWGKVWLVQAAVAVVALLAFSWARARTDRSAPWVFAALAALASGVMPALSGHSFGAERNRVAAIVLDALHTWGAAAWIGGLAMLFVVGLQADRATQTSGSRLSEWVRAFSPIALVSFAVLTVSGTFATWIHVGGVGPLFGSTYGRILLLKLTLIAGVAAVGWYNWKRVTPLLGTREGRRRFLARSVPVELLLGGAVLLATAVLVGTALPLEGH